MLRVESWVKETGTTEVSVVNNAPMAVAFRAFFTPDSPTEFGVEPRQGKLEAGAAATFAVSFSPETYGNTIEGHLVIATDAEEWRYVVLGAPPRYERPVVPPRVDARLDGRMLSAIEHAHAASGRRNFLRENIRESKAAAAVRQAASDSLTRAPFRTGAPPQ